MADDKKKGGSGKKKPQSKPTKNPRLAANKKLKDTFLIQIALKLLYDIAKAKKASKDPAVDPPKNPPK